MLVAGVAVAYLLSAVTSLLILFAHSEYGARAVMFWLLGSLANADWSTLPIGYLGMGAGMVLVFWWRRRLDLLALGDETAMASGVDPGRTRLQLVVVVAMCVGFAVSLSGGIGFVGLAAPHIARRIIGPIHPPSDPGIRSVRRSHAGLGRRRGSHGVTAPRAAHRRRHRRARRSCPRRSRPKAQSQHLSAPRARAPPPPWKETPR